MALLIAVALVSGCDRDSPKPSADAEPIFAVVRAQMKALNRRDVNAALAIMHPDAPGLARTRETTEKLLEAYDLIFMLQNLSLESVNENEARVRFTQMTQRASGPAFRNNRVVGIHTLRKFDGAWKLYGTEVISTEYFDK